MEKRVIGIILTLLGVVGLIMAAYTMMVHSGTVTNIKTICAFGILGAIFFVSGIGLVKSTKDVLKSDEHVS